MKKIMMTGAGLLLVLLLAGCGETKTSPPEQITPTAAPTSIPATATPVPEDDNDLVNMQVTSENPGISKIIGDQTATAQSIIVLNQTGGVISQFYVRRHPEDDDDDEWGVDLISGRFSLTNGDRMLYYFNRSGEQTPQTVYDLRIVYVDEDRSECYFRSIPLGNINQITLRMDGSGDESIPYATYMTATGTREYSTLDEVKKRLGLLDDDDENEEDRDRNEETEAETELQTEAPVEATTEEEIDLGEITGETNATTDNMETAENYMGSSLSELISAIGGDSGVDYVDEPESGNTGYHYYDGFTVATSVDENGNEIVSAIY